MYYTINNWKIDSYHKMTVMYRCQNQMSMFHYKIFAVRVLSLSFSLSLCYLHISVDMKDIHIYYWGFFLTTLDDVSLEIKIIAINLSRTRYLFKKGIDLIVTIFQLYFLTTCTFMKFFRRSNEQGCILTFLILFQLSNVLLLKQQLFDN